MEVSCFISGRTLSSHVQALRLCGIRDYPCSIIINPTVVIWIKRTLPPLDLSQFHNIGEVRDYASQVLNSGPTPYLLYPFRLLVRPYLAPNGHAFIAALWPAFALLLLHYFWVARSDVAFEEASIEASKKLAEKVAAVRSGNWQATRQNRKPKRAPFRLNPLGFQPVALLWKNLMSAGQAFTPRLWIVLASVTLGLGIGLRGSTGNADWLTVIGMLAGMLIIWSLLLGPQFFRQDLRQDLFMADVLKSYPMRGWQIVLGELLAPASILTGMQWFLLIIAATFPSGPFSAGASLSQRLALIFGAAILLPFLNLITLQIPNASVLLFPAWFQTSKEGAQGIEATGQRLILLLGQLIVFMVALLPSAAVFALVFFLLKGICGNSLAVSLSAVAAALVLAVEAGCGVMLLGWLFERFDIASELS